MKIPRQDRECLFDTVKLDEQVRGRDYLHTCRKCKESRYGFTPTYHRQCPKWYKGLGTKLHILLSIAKITPEMWERMTGQKCGCRKRIRALDKWITWI